MQRWYSLFLPRSARSISWLATMLVFAISFLAMIGWFLDIPPLTNVRPQCIRMSVITAACLTLASAHLVLLQVNPFSLRRFKVLQAPVVLVSLVGLLTVALYCFALVTGQEPSFGFASFLNPFWAPETRLALLTAFNFLLSGIALVLLAKDSRGAANIAHIIMLPGAMISYLVLISYLLGVQAWYGWLGVPMALNTSLAFCALSIAIFCVRPDTWLMTIFTNDQAGGIMARRFLPTLLLIPFLIGWLRLYGERSGAFASEVGVALVAVAYTFFLLILILLTAASLNLTDSERRRAETALMESDVRFRAFMDNSPAIAWAKDDVGRYVYLSKACENRFGIRLEDCRGKTDFDLWPQAIAEKFRQNDLEVLANGQTAEFIEENIDPDGSRCYWWNFKFPFSDAAGGRYVGGVGVDITELKQAEKALQESQVDLKRAQAVAKTGSWRLDVQNNKLDWSDETYRIFQIPPGTALTYESFLSTVYPEDKEYVDQNWTAALGGKPYNIEHRILSGGEAKWVREKAELEFDQKGHLLGGFGTVQDITELKQAEEALRRGESSLAEAQRIAHLGNWELDLERNEFIASNEIFRIFGLEPQEIIPTVEDFLNFVHPEDLPVVKHQLAEGKRSGKYGPFDYRIVRRDGLIRHVFAQGVTSYNKDGRPLKMVGIGQDITERKQAEEALRRAHDELEKRVKERTAELERTNEALRQSEENLRILTSQTLTAQEQERKRISYELHDGLGQSLTVLKLHLRTIQRMMPPSGPERDEFESALNYTNSIVENVRRLSKGLSPLMLEDLGLPTGLMNLFEETCKLEGIDCSFEMDDINTLLSSQAQIIIYRVCQAILNNATKHAHASRIELGIQRMDSGVQFSVMDNGIGFDVAQTLTSSLKDRGMGLAYMDEQVRMLGGTISIRSKKGEGTTIKITVPFLGRGEEGI